MSASALEEESLQPMNPENCTTAQCHGESRIIFFLRQDTRRQLFFGFERARVRRVNAVGG